MAQDAGCRGCECSWRRLWCWSMKDRRQCVVPGSIQRETLYPAPSDVAVFSRRWCRLLAAPSCGMNHVLLWSMGEDAKINFNNGMMRLAPVRNQCSGTKVKVMRFVLHLIVVIVVFSILEVCLGYLQIKLFWLRGLWIKGFQDAFCWFRSTELPGSFSTAMNTCNWSCIFFLFLESNSLQ